MSTTNALQAERVSVEDGKYTVVIESDGGLKALRYGEPWRDLTGDKLVYCLAAEIARLRAALEDIAKHADPYGLRARKALAGGANG